MYLSDGCFDDGDGGQFWGRSRVKHSNGMMEHIKDTEDFSECGRMSLGVHQLPIIVTDQVAINTADIDLEKLLERHTERDSNFFALRKKLVKHFTIQRRGGKLRWLRSLADSLAPVLINRILVGAIGAYYEFQNTLDSLGS